MNIRILTKKSGTEHRSQRQVEPRSTRLDAVEDAQRSKEGGDPTAAEGAHDAEGGDAATIS